MACEPLTLIVLDGHTEFTGRCRRKCVTIFACINTLQGISASGLGKAPLRSLFDTSKRDFLKINVSLEIEDPEIAPQLDALAPSIVESFQVYLRDLQLENLNGSAGLYRIKEELLVRVIIAAQPHKIKDVLFREMSVQ
ncbi:MAG: hypothetical protein CL569_12895 [Alphaproteobacteria bacterium]|nr:hypothetical protein [Alphaproteobacteria bacterium]